MFLVFIFKEIFKKYILKFIIEVKLENHWLE